MSIVKFMGTIWQTLKDANFSPVLNEQVFVFDQRYDIMKPDREQPETLMGVIMLSGTFVVAESYEHKDALKTKLKNAGIHCTSAKVEPPVPFHEAIE